MRRAPLADGKSISKAFRTQVLPYHRTQQMRCIWLRKTASLITVVEVFPGVKILKARKAVGCDLIQPETFKALNRFFSWLVCVKWPFVLDGHRKTGNQEWSVQYIRRETRENSPTTGTYFCFVSLEKRVPAALKMMSRDN